MSSEATDQAVLSYLADRVEEAIEDDFNEDGVWTDEEFADLKRRAFEWVRRARAGEASL